MKLKDKQIYLDKLIEYLARNGWNWLNYDKRQFSECDDLRMFGVTLLYEKFDDVKEIVALFDDNKDDEAMDLYNERINLVSDESMFEYYEHVLDNTNPWYV
jgi:hypothetical protein